MSLPQDTPLNIHPKKSSFLANILSNYQNAGTDAVVELILPSTSRRRPRLHKCWLQGTGTKNLCAHLFGIYKSKVKKKEVQNKTADNERAKRSSN